MVVPMGETVPVTTSPPARGLGAGSGSAAVRAAASGAAASEAAGDWEVCSGVACSGAACSGVAGKAATAATGRQKRAASRTAVRRAAVGRETWFSCIWVPPCRGSCVRTRRDIFTIQRRFRRDSTNPVAGMEKSFPKKGQDAGICLTSTIPWAVGCPENEKPT